MGTEFTPRDMPLLLMRLLPSGVLFVSNRGLVVFANPRAVELLGVDPAGRPSSEVFMPLSALARVVEDKEHRNQNRRAGASQELGFSVTEVRDESLKGYLVVFQDITELTRVRQERDRLLQVAAVNEVLPAVLHELKNPLAAVRATVEVLIEEHASEPIGVELHAVLNEVRRMGLTLDGFGRLNNDLRAARPSAIDEACRDAFTVLLSQAQAKGIAMTSEIATLPLLRFDPAAFRAIIFNLVTNAQHACRSGDTISLKVGLEGNELTVVVSDTGMGMSAEVVARATELFFTTREKGTGIGLALVQALVSSAKGQLDISSTPNQGTVVSIRLATELAQERETTCHVPTISIAS